MNSPLQYPTRFDQHIREKVIYNFHSAAPRISLQLDVNACLVLRYYSFQVRQKLVYYHWNKVLNFQPFLYNELDICQKSTSYQYRDMASDF